MWTWKASARTTVRGKPLSVIMPGSTECATPHWSVRFTTLSSNLGWSAACNPVIAQIADRANVGRKESFINVASLACTDYKAKQIFQNGLCGGTRRRDESRRGTHECARHVW